MDSSERLLLSGHLGWEDIEDLDGEIQRHRACINDLLQAIEVQEALVQEESPVPPPVPSALTTMDIPDHLESAPTSRDAGHVSATGQAQGWKDSDMPEHPGPSIGAREPTPGPSEDLAGGPADALDPAEWQVPFIHPEEGNAGDMRREESQETCWWL